MVTNPFVISTPQLCLRVDKIHKPVFVGIFFFFFFCKCEISVVGVQVERIITVMSNPRQYKIPDWFLNRQKDIKDGRFGQMLSNQLDNKLREDLERLKKIRAHRGLRHYWGWVFSDLHDSMFCGTGVPK